MTFICDYGRLIIIGNAKTHEIEALMDEEIETFVPKIIVVLAALYLSASFVGGQFHIFTSMIFSRIETGFHK